MGDPSARNTGSATAAPQSAAGASPAGEGPASGGSAAEGSPSEAAPAAAAAPPAPLPPPRADDDGAAAAAAAAMKGMQRSPSAALAVPQPATYTSAVAPPRPVVHRATGAGRRKRGNPLPAAAPADTLPQPEAARGGGPCEMESNDSLADDAELLLSARDCRGNGSGGSSGHRSRCAWSPELYFRLEGRGGLESF